MQTSPYRPVMALKAISDPRVLVLVLCFVACITFYYMMLDFDRPLQDLTKIKETIFASEHTIKLLVDMETGQRGFLVGGKPEFLEPYLSGKQQLSASFSGLADLLHGDATLNEHLDNARHLAKQWQTNTAAEIEQRKTGADYVPSFNTGTGKSLMDRIRSEFEFINNAEQDKQSAAIKDAKDSWPRVFLVTIFVAMLASFILLRLFGQLRRANDNYRDANDNYRLQFEEVKDRDELINLAHDAIIVRNIDSEVKFWNKGAMKLYGYSPEEAHDKVTHTLLKTKFPVSQDETDRCLRNDNQWEGRLEHLHKDGSTVVVQSRQVLTIDAARKPRILEINRDITDEENFLKDVSHDMRNPVNLILLCVEAASSDDNLAAVRDRLKIMDMAASSMALLVNDVLAIYKEEIKSEEFTLRQFYDQLGALHANQDKGTSYTVKTEIDDNLPLRTDRQKLFRCLSNLLGNAFKFAPGGSIVLQITPTADDRLMFAVIDNGPGRGKSATVKEGFGRGLSIAKRYAKLLGGDLYYPQPQPSGCRFEVIVPITFKRRPA